MPYRTRIAVYRAIKRRLPEQTAEIIYSFVLGNDFETFIQKLLQTAKAYVPVFLYATDAANLEIQAVIFQFVQQIAHYANIIRCNDKCRIGYFFDLTVVGIGHTA